ncbi:hypothetical protein [Saccharothrix australiensis]|uniref:Uncharacterized protein n=1 Tax=Saccharothrix australiensis TaxID=2072 RepID=A0A495W094_9PSEU|nr:hypothetical protein [Saccharothrix australiensis]RKT54193.1 hypothetical protein C8E97_2807 [Saccharothrix australiensis]
MAKKSTPRDGCGHRRGVRGGGGYTAVFETPAAQEKGKSLFVRVRALLTSLSR